MTRTGTPHCLLFCFVTTCLDPGDLMRPDITISWLKNCKNNGDYEHNDEENGRKDKNRDKEEKEDEELKFLPC